MDDVAKFANEAMQFTSQLFTELSAAAEQSIPPNATQLKKWKKLAAKSNKGIMKSTRLYWAREDRGRLEATILQEQMSRERLDRDANAARVIEKLRSHSALAHDIDRACGAAAHLQSLLAQLAPVPATGYHGAAFLSIPAILTLPVELLLFPCGDVYTYGKIEHRKSVLNKWRVPSLGTGDAVCRSLCDDSLFSRDEKLKNLSGKRSTDKAAFSFSGSASPLQFQAVLVYFC